MKIAYTISGLYNSGGMENILIQKANYLADILGYNITIITTDQKNRPTFFPISKNIELIDLGINYCDAKSSHLWHLKKYLLKNNHKQSLADLLYKKQFDIVISLMDFDFSFLHSLKDGSRKILEYHFAKYSKVNATNNKLKKFLQRVRIERWSTIVSKYEKFIVLTYEDKNQWKNLKNISVIPNFINSIPNIQAQLANKRVISVGRADFQKGFDILIDAWKFVHDSHPDWELNIIGGGEKQHLYDQIKELKLSKSIKLLPPTKDIGKEYANSSLYVMSSRYEGLPLVLLEAMSFGLPIVSFDCPCGPKDILKPTYSTLVKSGDIRALANAIIEWISDIDRRIYAGNKAREEANLYLKDQIMNIWDNLFKSLK